MEDNDAFFDQFHKEHPDTVIGLTEYGADSVIKLQSPKPQKGDYTESYMAVYHEHMLEMISQRPYLWGTYVWNMFEFAAAGRDEAGDPGKNHKLITFDRKVKKMPIISIKHGGQRIRLYTFAVEDIMTGLKRQRKSRCTQMCRK